MVYFILNLCYLMKIDQIEIKKIFQEPADSSEMTCYIRGVGIHEPMLAGIVDRPTGTGDWLLMCFHEQVYLKSTSGIAEYPAGSWIIWTDRDSHYYGRNDQEWSHSWVHFDGKSVAPMVVDCGFKTNVVMHLDSQDILKNSLIPIYQEIIEQSDPDRIMLQNLLQNLLRRLSRQMGKTGTDIMPKRVLKIKNLLESHPSRRYTIGSLAKEASMSVPHFCAEFKKYVGTAPIDYLIKMRLQQARYLLYDHNQSIAEIATRVGYNDIFHFSKQFKKHFGVSPKKLR